MGMILDYVKSTIIEIAIQKILSFLSPVGAFIQAVIAIYNTIMFFIERLNLMTPGREREDAADRAAISAKRHRR